MAAIDILRKHWREETRILATLSLGCRRSIPITALKFIRRASMQWTRGERVLAHFELAYARLPRFETRDEAKSLFYADGFLRIGISPRPLMLARGLDTSPLTGTKLYRPRTTGNQSYWLANRLPHLQHERPWNAERKLHSRSSAAVCLEFVGEAAAALSSLRSM